MTNTISLRSGPARLVRRGRSAAGPQGRVASRLLRAIAGVIRRELTVRELRRLSDRHLRDIGLDRMDVADPSHTTVAWDAGTGTCLRLGAPDP